MKTTLPGRLADAGADPQALIEAPPVSLRRHTHAAALSWACARSGHDVAARERGPQHQMVLGQPPHRDVLGGPPTGRPRGVHQPRLGGALPVTGRPPCAP
jgi:hypothetical protein